MLSQGVVENDGNKNQNNKEFYEYYKSESDGGNKDDEVMGSFDSVSNEQIEILAKFIMIKKERNILNRISNKLLEFIGEIKDFPNWAKTMKAVRRLMKKTVHVISDLYDEAEEKNFGY
uniref:Uncharacterized protein n=1 Tax=Strongyloides papillosus TaxID=174720 RepID=A0A0N5C7X0_STREA